MTEPKRFRLGYFDDERCKLYDDPEGEFVTYDDYEALRLAAQSPEPFCWIADNDKWRGHIFYDRAEAEKRVSIFGGAVRAVYTAPPRSASDGALREALKPRLAAAERMADGITAFLDKPEWQPSRAYIEQARNVLRNMVRHVHASLAASEATKSDGIVEGHDPEGTATVAASGMRESRPRDMEAAGSQREAEAGWPGGSPRAMEQASNRESQDSDRVGGPAAARGGAGIKPGPSDTRPADVTVTPRVIDNDRDEIVVTLNGNELRGWSYSTEQERRVKMLCAREFVEGFCAGRQS